MVCQVHSIIFFKQPCKERSSKILNNCSSMYKLAKILLERLRTNHWNFKTQITHVSRHPGAYSTTRINYRKKNNYIICSQILGKVFVKRPWKTVKIKYKKTTKNMKLSTIFGGFGCPNDPSNQFSEATLIFS